MGHSEALTLDLAFTENIPLERESGFRILGTRKQQAFAAMGLL